jgi:hypothetical protein
VKTTPPELLWNDFLVAERAYLAASPGGPDMRALRWAYLDGIMCRAEWRRTREQYYRVIPGERARLDNLCTELRRNVVTFK